MHTNINNIMKSQKCIIEIKELQQFESKAKSTKESESIISGKREIVKKMSIIRQSHRERCHFILQESDVSDKNEEKPGFPCQPAVGQEVKQGDPTK